MFGGPRLPGRGHTIHKGFGAGLCLMCWRNSGEAVFLEQSGRGGERKQKRAGRGRAGRAGPRGLHEDAGFHSGWWEPWRAAGRAEGEPDSGAHTLPLVAGAGKTDCGGEGGSRRWCSQAPSGGFLGEDRMCGNGEKWGGCVQGGGAFTSPSE